MATRKKKFDIKNVVFAAAGGASAGLITTVLENNISYFDENPKLTPLALAGITAAGLYFMEEYDAGFYGMIVAAGGDIAAQLIGGNDDEPGTTKSLAFLDSQPTPISSIPMAQNLPSINDTNELFEDDFFNSQIV